ncbi:Putative signal transduction histidine kinase [Magnetospirillum sp. XM-1]|uniref:sensor histidine kinase n=1 Tax=Magnetospirillum sp. XM-1 TaxID=1663591 RepID=UPI00073E0FC4|nr:ATP-binding protein [Magnetospirillum sp. XM-1]CUW41323.1 Putative signal transduction histidine kinase [Magnetospirillum sp. XM-1]
MAGRSGEDAARRGGNGFRDAVIRLLLQVPLNLLFVGGTVFAVVVAELVAASVSLAMIGHVPAVVWVGAFFAPLVVAPAELAVLVAVIGRMRDEMGRRHQAERHLLEDVARRRQVETELRANEEKLRAMFDKSPLGMARNTLDGAFLEANPAFLAVVGYDLEELQSLSYWDLTPFRFADSEACQLERLETVGHYGPYEKEYIRKNGTRVPVRMSGMLGTGSDGEGYIWSIVEDITESQKAERALVAKSEELARSNADLEQFAFIASHDLREPLRMVSAYMGLLERRFGPLIGAEGGEYIGYAKEGAQRMDRLVLDLLEFSRVGRMEEALEPVALDEVLDGVLADLSPAIGECGAQIERPVPLPTLPAIRGEMAQLLQNLIGNSLKYRDPSRPLAIRVAARRDGAQWVVEVGDNGIGIAAEYRERIFRIFQRLHTRDRFEGTGIGLAICKRIVERHGGRIRVDSVAGEGATFSFALPA